MAKSARDREDRAIEQPPREFPLAAGVVRVAVVRAPIAAGVFVLAGVTLVLLLLLVVLPSAVAPVINHLLWAALFTILAAVRLLRVVWPQLRQDGPARLVVDQDGLTMVADGERTHLAWKSVKWVGVTHGVPPRKQSPTLVVWPKAKAEPPAESGRRGWLPIRYQPHPRWFPQLGLVRVIDLALLRASESEVTEAVMQVAGRRWRR
ncbi:hypothetical protein JQS43_22705 [Natronosporangium hydrolyticum]|uniref:Uncharacterized protein n=1 Tax=Natronosporangium hydrolyticum TaxID=2811111 RepID=A0A895YDM1_9ACTN|nr:hypothetical protein [Natronosporangium hydrolyticum]QSB14285.1 hypothetical protein JQS43_22705 [Natronosporangium hydrolyticum]